VRSLTRRLLLLLLLLLRFTVQMSFPAALCEYCGLTPSYPPVACSLNPDGKPNHKFPQAAGTLRSLAGRGQDTHCASLLACRACGCPPPTLTAARSLSALLLACCCSTFVCAAHRCRRAGRRRRYAALRTRTRWEPRRRSAL